MKLTLWRHEVALRHPIASSRQVHDARTRLYLRVEHDGIEGFGELDPQPSALHGDPGVADVVQELDGVVLLQVQMAFEREGSLPSWTRLARFAGSRDASPWAVALVEMALFDRELRAEGVSLEERWPARFDTPVQSTVSILEPSDVFEIPSNVTRVRVKTAPGALGPREIERLGAIGRPLLLDFNCSANDDQQVLDQVALARGVAHVAAVEQPFAPGNLVDHARLVEQLEVPLSLDESVRNLRDLVAIERYRAAQIVCVKPARVGGYATARTMLERAKELGLRAYVGGFFEADLARLVNRTLARHAVEEPSDIGAVLTREEDAFAPFLALDGGFGLVPSKELLEKCVLVASFG
jgi:O-succinylbenzoate synthase